MYWKSFLRLTSKGGVQFPFPWIQAGLSDWLLMSKMRQKWPSMTSKTRLEKMTWLLPGFLMGPLEFMKSPEPCVMVSFLRSPLCTDQMQSLSRYSWRSPSCHIFLTHLSGMWVTKTWGYFSLTYHLNVTTSSQNHPAEPFLDSWPPPPTPKMGDNKWSLLL